MTHRGHPHNRMCVNHVLECSAEHCSVYHSALALCVRGNIPVWRHVGDDADLASELEDAPIQKFLDAVMQVLSGRHCGTKERGMRATAGSWRWRKQMERHEVLEGGPGASEASCMEPGRCGGVALLSGESNDGVMGARGMVEVLCGELGEEEASEQLIAGKDTLVDSTRKVSVYEELKVGQPERCSRLTNGIHAGSPPTSLTIGEGCMLPGASNLTEEALTAAERITIRKVSLTSEALECLRSAKSLRVLHLEECSGDIRLTHSLCCLGSLAELHLHALNGVESINISELPRLGTIRMTGVNRVKKIRIESCVQLQRVEGIRTLSDIGRSDQNGTRAHKAFVCPLSEETTEEIDAEQRAHAIKKLSVNTVEGSVNTDVSCAGVVRGLDALSGLPSLQELYLAAACVDDAFVRDLTCHDHLRKLSLRSCTRITDVSPLGRMYKLEVLNINYCAGVVHGLDVLCGLPSLQELYLAAVCVDDAFVRNLTCHDHLRKLSLHSCTRVTDVSPLGRMHRLEVLDLNYCTSIVHGLDALCGLPSLQELYLAAVCVDDAFVRDLTCHDHLRKLSLRSCTRITDVSPLGRMRQLEMLNVNYCAGVVRGLDALCGLPSLQELFLTMVCVDDAFVRDLTCHEHLRIFIIYACTRVTDVSPLGRMRQLEMLHLSCCTGVVRGLDALCGLPSLQELYLTEVCVDDAFVRDLTCHEHLRKLSLRSCTRITDVSPLGRMHKLEVLDLSCCTSVVRGLDVLCGLPSLQELHLDEMCVDDAFVRDLTCHEHLRKLSLHSCTRVTDVSPLGHMRKLEYLNINNCSGIRTIFYPTFLTKLPKIKTLYLRNVSITSSAVELLQKKELNLCI
ncbi:hypothetical protein ERJ75_000821600 [Trypanosoma vivax]|nr:hypothetical protein ERJ75_000821600 [Trypanosoma vivax]